MNDSLTSNAKSHSKPKKPPKTLPDSTPEASKGTWEIVVYLAQFENLEHVREFVGKAAQKCGLDAAAVYAVQLAADEAFSNIIEHAYGGECLDKVECKCQLSDTGLTVILRDCGSPFDPADVPEPDLTAELEERDIGGLGLYFIRQLMDEVDFSFMRDPETGKRCNVLRMRKLKGG